MASTYSSNLNIELITSGEQAGTWGDTTNQNWKRVEQSISKKSTVNLGGTTSAYSWELADTADADASGSEGRSAFVEFTNAGAAITVNIRGNSSTDYPNRVFFAYNNSGYALTFDSNASSDFVLASGAAAAIYTDPGTAAGNIFNTFQVGSGADGLVLSNGKIQALGGAVSFDDDNITNVGSISLDSIAADDGSSFSFSNNWTAAGRTCANLGTVTTADINGGSIDGTDIGAGTPGTGAFTTLTASGNVDLGNATSDTITATGRFDSDLVPSSNNARDLGASSFEWKDLYLDGTANIDSLVADTADINGGSIDAVTIGTNTAVTELQVDNININANTISSTNTDGHLIIQPNGDGNVELQTDTVDIGTGTENKFITTSNTGYLKLNTNGGDNASSITLRHESDTNLNHIDIDPNGSSNIRMFPGGGSGDLTLSDNDISGVGTVTAANATITSNLDVDGNTTLDTTDVAGTLTVVGNAVVDQVTVNAGTVSTSSGNLTLDSSGGTVAINDNATVSGNLTVTGTTTLSTPLANSSLANSAVSYGGVTVSLGEGVAAPGFNLSNATGLPISSGVSGLGSNVATFLGTPSSANLRSALTDETGTGAAVFANGPTLVAPALGTPDSGNLANCTFPTLNQDTTGTAANATTATNVTVTANNSADETVYPIFVDGATGAKGAESDTGLTYNPSSGLLTLSQIDSKGKAGSRNFVAGAGAGNALEAGATDNIIIGDGAGNAQTSADNNILIGSDAGGGSAGITTAEKTILIGSDTGLKHSTSALTGEDVGIGYNALKGVGGYYNVAIGTSALEGRAAYSPDDSNYDQVRQNVSLGYESMQYTGTSSMSNLVTDNVAVGFRALRGVNTYGVSGASENVGVGALALEDLRSGEDNSCIGSKSGRNITTGSNNVTIGSSAGDTITTGDSNVLIGMSVDSSANSSSNQIAIGHNITGVDDKVCFGKSGNVLSASYTGEVASVTWSATSDINIKKNIEPESIGLSLINKLNPVQFNFKSVDDLSDEEDMYFDYVSSKSSKRCHGFIAQEVEEAAQSVGIDSLDGLYVDAKGVYQFGATAFIQPMVKAIQELSSKIDSLESRLAALE
jgi:hypothetical protein